MKKETYLKLTKPVRENKKKARLLSHVNGVLTIFVFLLYPIFLLQLYAEHNPFFLRALLIPAVSFAAVSVFRVVINAPRPYEKFGLPPTLSKETKGKSFPSRHVFSIYIIAMTVLYVYPDAGFLLGVLGLVLAAIRVVGGVHEPRDVIAGALFGILCGLLYYLPST